MAVSAMFLSRTWARRPCYVLRLRFEPGLEHQHMPEMIVPIALTRLVLLPLRFDRLRIEITLATQSIRMQQRLGPLFQWPAEPGVDGHVEAALGPFDQL